MDSGWIQLLKAGPLVLLYGLGEFALWLAITFVLLAVISWLVGRVSSRPRRLPSPAGFLILAALAGVPATVYLLSEPGSEIRFGRTPAVPSAGLMPPVGREWPEKSAYLAVPQRAEGGTGVLRIIAPSSRVYVKLCEAGRTDCAGLRRAYLLAGDTFDMRNLQPGSYEMRYLPIDHPGLGGRTAALQIGGDGSAVVSVQLSSSLSLHSQTNGIEGISPDEF